MPYGRCVIYMFPGDAEEIIDKARTEILPIFKSQPGFVAYELMATDDGTVCSMTIFEDRDGAERSQELAARFVREHLSHIEMERLGGWTGEAMVSRARERVLEAAHH